MTTSRLSTLRARLGARPRASAGETLVETLVALTIAGLALIMLAVAIGVSSNIISMSRNAADAYYAATDSLIDESGYGRDGAVRVTETDTTVASGTYKDFAVSYATSDDSGTGLPGGAEAIAYRAKS